MTELPSSEELIKQILGTVEVAWRNKIDRSIIDRWLQNFTGEAIKSNERERRLALWLLYNFTYYNEDEIKYLCRLLLRKYLHEHLTTDKVTSEEINKILSQSSFLPLGKNSESGAYVLYLFRQENDLPVTFFNSEDTMESVENENNIVFVDDMTLSGNQAIRNILRVKYGDCLLKDSSILSFLDESLVKETNSKRKELKEKLINIIDCHEISKEELAQTINDSIIKNANFLKCIGGKDCFEDADDTLKELIKYYYDNKDVDNNDVKKKIITYKMNRLLLEYIFDKEIVKSRKIIKNNPVVLLTFIASEKAKKVLADENVKVINCIELDETAKVFSENSMMFTGYEAEKVECRKMCEFYGKKIKESYPLGYDDGQYIFGLYYTIPNNTLPIFWATKNWNPLFIRHEKRYGGNTDVRGKFI